MATVYETRGVLAGAYRGRSTERALLTHVAVVEDGVERRTLCRQPVDNLVDRHGMTDEERQAEPTCTTCRRRLAAVRAKP